MVEIYADCADLAQIWKWSADPRISGITTNPSLMKKAGIDNYREFAKQVLERVTQKPVSLEVLSDDWSEMEDQALALASMGKNVWVKIPVTNTKGQSSCKLMERLLGINLNVTAVMTREQCFTALDILKPTDILSIFAGRVADTGKLATSAIAYGVNYKARGYKANILWASAREIYNYYEASSCGCDIITLTPDLLAKLSLRDKDLTQYSLETVQMFYEDGKGITF